MKHRDDLLSHNAFVLSAAYKVLTKYNLQYTEYNSVPFITTQNVGHKEGILLLD